MQQVRRDHCRQEIGAVLSNARSMLTRRQTPEYLIVAPVFMVHIVRFYRDKEVRSAPSHVNVLTFACTQTKRSFKVFKSPRINRVLVISGQRYECSGVTFHRGNTIEHGTSCARYLRSLMRDAHRRASCVLGAT